MTFPTINIPSCPSPIASALISLAVKSNSLVVYGTIIQSPIIKYDKKQIVLLYIYFEYVIIKHIETCNILVLSILYSILSHTGD